MTKVANPSNNNVVEDNGGISGGGATTTGQSTTTNPNPPPNISNNNKIMNTVGSSKLDITTLKKNNKNKHQHQQQSNNNNKSSSATSSFTTRRKESPVDETLSSSSAKPSSPTTMATTATNAATTNNNAGEGGDGSSSSSSGNNTVKHHYAKKSTSNKHHHHRNHQHHQRNKNIKVTVRLGDAATHFWKRLFVNNNDKGGGGSGGRDKRVVGSTSSSSRSSSGGVSSSGATIMKIIQDEKWRKDWRGIHLPPSASRFSSAPSAGGPGAAGGERDATERRGVLEGGKEEGQDLSNPSGVPVMDDAASVVKKSSSSFGDDETLLSPILSEDKLPIADNDHGQLPNASPSNNYPPSTAGPSIPLYPLLIFIAIFYLLKHLLLKHVFTYQKRTRLARSIKELRLLQSSGEGGGLMWFGGNHRQFRLSQDELEDQIRKLKRKSISRRSKSSTDPSMGGDETPSKKDDDGDNGDDNGADEGGGGYGDNGPGDNVNNDSGTSSNDNSNGGKGGEGHSSKNNGGGSSQQPRNNTNNNLANNDTVTDQSSFLQYMRDSEELERAYQKIEQLTADAVCANERAEMLHEKLSEVKDGSINNDSGPRSSDSHGKERGHSSKNNGGSSQPQPCNNNNLANNDVTDQPSFLQYMRDSEELEHAHQKIEQLTADAVCANERAEMLHETLSKVKDELLAAQENNTTALKARYEEQMAKLEKENAILKEENDQTALKARYDEIAYSLEEVKVRYYEAAQQVVKVQKENIALSEKVSLLEEENEMMDEEMEHLVDEMEHFDDTQQQLHRSSGDEHEGEDLEFDSGSSGSCCSGSFIGSMESLTADYPTEDNDEIIAKLRKELNLAREDVARLTKERNKARKDAQNLSSELLSRSRSESESNANNNNNSNNHDNGGKERSFSQDFTKATSSGGSTDISFESLSSHHTIESYEALRAERDELQRALAEAEEALASLKSELERTMDDLERAMECRDTEREEGGDADETTIWKNDAQQQLSVQNGFQETELEAYINRNIEEVHGLTEENFSSIGVASVDLVKAKGDGEGKRPSFSQHHDASHEEQDLKSLETTLFLLKSDKDELALKLENAEARIVCLEKEKEVGDTDKAAAAATLKSGEDFVGGLKEENKSLSVQNKDLMSQLEEATVKFESEKKQCMLYVDEVLSSLKLDKTKLTSKLEKAKAHIVRLQKEEEGEESEAAKIKARAVKLKALVESGQDDDDDGVRYIELENKQLDLSEEAMQECAAIDPETDDNLIVDFNPHIRQQVHSASFDELVSSETPEVPAEQYQAEAQCREMAKQECAILNPPTQEVKNNQTQQQQSSLSKAAAHVVSERSKASTIPSHGERTTSVEDPKTIQTLLECADNTMQSSTNNAKVNADLSRLITCLEGELHHESNGDGVNVDTTTPKKGKVTSLRRLWSNRVDGKKRSKRSPATKK